ncbi:hypothetical protein LguiA_004947 [Lonicera macranthoides]
MNIENNSLGINHHDPIETQITTKPWCLANLPRFPGSTPVAYRRPNIAPPGV